MASIKRSIITHESLSKKILADDGTQYMACCCGPTPTPTPTPSCCGERSIDVTFSGITDCGLLAHDCGSYEGITFTLPFYIKGSYEDPDEDYCVWRIITENDTFINLALFTSGADSGKIILQLWHEYWGGDRILCFNSERYDAEVDSCDDIPITNIPNALEIGDCGVAHNAEGYGGTADIDWT